MNARVFIDGAAGTTGLQIWERLEGRQDIDLIRLDDAARKDATARRDALHAADVAILCLPDDAAREVVAMLGNAPTRLIDASTAHRVNPDWAYGFAEMTSGQLGRIAEARLVANPGCYPTGAIALIRPLREAGILPADHPVSVNAVSGYTGGGKAMIAEFEADGALGGFSYGLAQTHKHLPEIREYSLLDEAPIFVPSVGRFAQGMIVQVPLHLSALPRQPSRADLREALAAHFEGAAEVEVAPLDDGPARLDPQALNGTNKLRLHVSGAGSKAVLSAVLDNLGKGASGAAVQNLDLMLG